MWPPPFGYRKEDGKLIEVLEEAKVLRRIFDLFLGLRSYRGVARRLNEEGVPTRKGGAWTSGTIGQILKNPVHSGANVYGRHEKGDTRLKPPEEWTVVPGMRKPMIVPKKFEAAQALIDEGGPNRAPQAPATYLLSGLIRCGKCLSPMCGHTRRKSKKVYRYYVCNASQHKGKGYCPGTSINADRLEGAVIAKVRDKAAEHGSQATTNGASVATDAAQKERQRFANAVERAKYRSSRLFELYEDGLMSKGEFKERMQAMSAKRRELKARLEALTATTTAPPENVPGDWDRLDDEGRRALLRAWIRELVVQGTTVDLVLADLAGLDETVSVNVVSPV